MEGFFGLLLILGLVGIVLSLAMRKKENLIGKNYKKVLFGSIVVIVVCCVIAAVTAPKAEPLDIDVDIPEVESGAVSSTPISSQPIVENPSAVSPDSSETVVSATEAVSNSSAAVSSETGSGNPLLLAEWQTAPVMNGSKTEQIGERGYIRVTKAVLKEVTNEQMVEFVEKRVKDSGLNWVSIICGDGTGIAFLGSSEFILTYGDMDPDGSLQKTIKDYRLKDGVYEEWE